MIDFPLIPGKKEFINFMNETELTKNLNESGFSVLTILFREPEKNELQYKKCVLQLKQ